MIRAQTEQALGHLVGLDAVAIALLAVFLELTLQLGDVGAEPHHLALDQHIEAVAVGQRLVGDGDQVALVHFLHAADQQPGEGRRVEGADVHLALGDEVIGAATVEGLVRIGHEEVRGAPAGGAGQVRAVFENGVEFAAVVGGDVLHVGHILVAALDLERAHAGLDQGAQVGALVVVLHRQQVFLVGDHAALFILEGVGQAAGLRAVAAVGAAPGLRMGDVALAGEGHAQRAVDEEFDGRVCGIGNLADFLQVQLARQHQLGEAGLVEKLGPLKGADVGLGAGVQLDRRDIQLHHAHVLHDQRIHARVVELVDQRARRLQLIVMQDGVDRGEHPCVIVAGELHQPGDITHFIAGIVPRAEARAADIDGVGAMQNGLAGDLDVTRRAEQFQVVLGQGHGVFFYQAGTRARRALYRADGLRALARCRTAGNTHRWRYSSGLFQAEAWRWTTEGWRSSINGCSSTATMTRSCPPASWTVISPPSSPARARSRLPSGIRRSGPTSRRNGRATRMVSVS